MLILVLMIFLTDHSFKAAVMAAPEGSTKEACEIRGKAIATELLKDTEVADVQTQCIAATLRTHT